MRLPLVACALACVACGGIGGAQTQLRTAVDAKRPDLDRCYAATLTKRADAAGSMKLVIHVTEKGGRVDKVNIASTTLRDVELEDCVKSTLVGVQVEPAPKANLEVEYVLEFAQPAG